MAGQKFEIHPEIHRDKLWRGTLEKTFLIKTLEMIYFYVYKKFSLNVFNYMNKIQKHFTGIYKRQRVLGRLC